MRMESIMDELDRVPFFWDQHRFSFSKNFHLKKTVDQVLFVSSGHWLILSVIKCKRKPGVKTINTELFEPVLAEIVNLSSLSTFP